MNDTVQLPAFAAEGNNCTVGSPSTQHIITDEQLAVLENNDSGLAKDFALLFGGGALGLLAPGVTAFRAIMLNPDRVKAADAFNLLLLGVSLALTVILVIAWFRSGSPKKTLVTEIRGRPKAKVTYSTESP